MTHSFSAKDMTHSDRAQLNKQYIGFHFSLPVDVLRRSEAQARGDPVANQRVAQRNLERL